MAAFIRSRSFQIKGRKVQSKIRIGKEEFNTNIFLAPLSGCSDLAFRLIAREHGAKFCFFEMLDSTSLGRGTKKTLDILKTVKGDSPIAAQLLGADPAQMLRAAKVLLEHAKVSFLDINSACPARKVIKKLSGAYLLKEPTALYGAIETLSSSLSIPITVKMRLGYDNKDLDKLAALAMRCERHGASALFVHGRTRLEGYKGNVDYRAIKVIKDSVGIPVFGSGDILTAGLAKKMFDSTGCDGICVARGALGNPWIFREIEDYLGDGALPSRRPFLSKKAALKRHLSLIDRHKEISPSGKIGFMRKVALWYLKSFPKAKVIRGRIGRANSHRELLEAIDHTVTDYCNT